MRRARRWLRGKYLTDSGMYFVTARRWWSPRERKSARLAAKLISLQEEQVALKVRRLAVNLALYGSIVPPDDCR